MRRTFVGNAFEKKRNTTMEGRHAKKRLTTDTSNGSAEKPVFSIRHMSTVQTSPNRIERPVQKEVVV